MAGSNKSIFCKSALASGLVTRQDLDQALADLKAAGRGGPSDEELAARLVELGRINRWQAGQLLAGRSKFTLGPYQILDAIGQGGMGEVYKAEHAMMRRIVAIKVLPRAKSTPETIASFCREIQTHAQLEHENLVRAYDAGHDGKVYFLVTEFVPGTDLRRHIKRHGRLAMQAGASIICQAARGLEYAHQRGLIHRDIKPGNLLISLDGKTKLSDLGLADYFTSQDDDVRDIYDGKIVGTADYLAPEQVLAPEKQGPASDIYSLGCTLYYAVTGKVPFPGGSPRDKARAHCHLQPLDPRRLAGDLDDEFVDVIADMMAKDPAERISSAAEVIRRLAPWAGEDWVRSAQAVEFRAGERRRPVEADFLVGRSAEALEDTRPVLEGPEPGGAEEAPSQVSQTTHPMASAEEETAWLRELKARRPAADSGLPITVLIVILVVLALAAIILNAMSRFW